MIRRIDIKQRVLADRVAAMICAAGIAMLDHDAPQPLDNGKSIALRASHCASRRRPSVRWLVRIDPKAGAMLPHVAWRIRAPPHDSDQDAAVARVRSVRQLDLIGTR
jgi:hypothetical protein